MNQIQRNRRAIIKRRLAKQKWKANPYAPFLTLLYQFFIFSALSIVLWMAYEAFVTARVGINEHKQKTLEYRKAVGLDKPIPIKTQRVDESDTKALSNEKKSDQSKKEKIDDQG